MRIDLIALDLDGTLLSPDETISAANRHAIRAALERGIRVVLVTGRGADLPMQVSKDLNLNLPVICCHGALTKDFGANRTLVHTPVPLEHALTLVKFAEAKNLNIAVYHEELFWRLRGSQLYMDDMLGPTWREVESISQVLTAAPTFIRFLGRPAVEAMEAELKDLPLNFRYETWYDFLECAVLSLEAGKQQALARLCADFQIMPRNVLSIGDSRNDVPMLKWSGVGVAMANALPEVRESVKYVTASNSEDGVALAIERFVLSDKGAPPKQRAQERYDARTSQAQPPF
jgi:Cof subfamily protein (haloacid dehalogenase superfamily)